MYNNTPIIIGIGEICEPVPADLKAARSMIELAADASKAAINDTNQTDRLQATIDAIVTVRTFADSSPMYPNPFGTVNNTPRAIGRLIDLDPQYASYAVAGGQSPQKLVNEYSSRLAAGEFKAVLVVGGEVIANTKAAIRKDISLDWQDDTEGQLDDRGIGLSGIITRQELDNDLMAAPASYGLLENARRQKLNISRDEYRKQMGELLSPFSKTAADHPTAMFPYEMAADTIANVTNENPYIAEPYTRAMVAKDGVNQAAALVLTTVGHAREMGVDESRWIYLHSHCDLQERPILERSDAGAAPAMSLTYQTALNRAGITADQVNFFDLYSCFPIAIFNACDALGLAIDDPRGLTVTGGLPFFGGAGNNYAMHALVSLVRKLRTKPNRFGLIGANGGILSKHSVGVYSSKAPQHPWENVDNRKLQQKLNQAPAPKLALTPEGEATIETYSITYRKGVPYRAHIIGRIKETDEQFLAVTDNGDRETPVLMAAEDPLHQTVYVTSEGPGNRFSYDRNFFKANQPDFDLTLRDNYKYCQVEIRGHVLEVTINRPEVKNCLTPEANQELSEIFDIYESDDQLWVAIITGAGEDAFCAGNDLKYTAKGGKLWLPKSGFGGLTHREGFYKPVIAAVNGVAMGGGMEIALACDLVVASDNAVFALPEVKVGLIAGAGGIQRLTRQIPMKQAMEMILTGKRVTSEQAQELGFVNHVVAKGDALNRARQLAEEILICSPLSISCTKQLLDESADVPNANHSLQLPFKSLDRLLTSEDLIEGVQAFSQKRKPQWKGR